MEIDLSGPISITPRETVRFTVKRVKDTPCKAGWKFEGWETVGLVQRPDDHTVVQACTASQNIGAKCKATVAVDFRKDDQGTYDPDEEYDVIIEGNSGHSITVPFSPPPVVNAQSFDFQVKQP